MAASGSPWGVLIAVCTYSWAVYFLCCFPSALSTPLQLYLGLPESQYAYLISALYTAYSTPNIILPFFAGPLVRRCGERSALLLTLMSVVLGQIVVVFSIQMRMQSGMIAGRLLFGLGGEIAGVLACEIITRSFRKNASTFLTIMFSSGRLGIVTTSMAMQPLSEAYGVVAASWISTGITLAAASLSMCYLVCIDRGKIPDTEEGDNNNNDDDDDEEPAPKDSNTASLSILTSYPYVFWLLGLICVLGYGSIGTFNNSAQRFLASVFYDGDQITAGYAMSLLYIVSSVLSPLLSYLLNLPFLNHPPTTLLLASLLLLLSHTLFLTTSSAIFPLGILGIASAIFSVSFWANLTQCLVSTAKSFQQKLLAPGPGYGTIARARNTPENDAYRQEIITLGFGCMVCVINLASAAIPILLAMAESVAGYEGLEMVFWMLGLLGCLVSGHLVVVDRYM